MTYSVVAPVYNESATLPHFYRRVSAVLEALDAPYELILVDDGSRDTSLEIMRSLRADAPRVQDPELFPQLRPPDRHQRRD